MDNSSYIVHHGIKDMRWGVRRYQTKDGALTPAGRKRYNKDTAKLKAKKKVLQNEERTRKKIEQLEKLKDDVNEMKKKSKEAVKDPQNDQKSKNKDDVEQKREQLLKSSDPKELYENKDLLTTNELNERINRIDTEMRLKSKIVEEPSKKGIDYINDKMKNTSQTISNVNNVFKNVDDTYKTVINSAIGKTIAKKLGLDPPREEFNFNDFWNNRHKKTRNEMEEAVRWLNAEEKMRKRRESDEARERTQREAEERLREAQRQVDEYNRRLYDESESGRYGFRGSDLTNNRDYIERDGSNRPRLENREHRNRR